MNKILLIDDDLDFNESLTDILEYEGYEVACAFNGKQGLDLVKQEQPDLIISDIIMPDVDGLGFLMALRNELKSQIKVVIISGGGRVGGTDYLNMAQSLGADEVVEKPLDKHDFLERIKRLLPH